MRLTSLIAVLLALMFMLRPAAAQDSLAESVIERAQPLLKALSLLGTPYKFGGNQPDKGLDCSGFVTHVYRESAGISLPRSAREMSREGEEIARDALRPGDLVFFDTLDRPYSHVGIYAGEGRFVHASSRRARAVTISRMDASYWASRFNGARRVLALD